MKGQSFILSPIQGPVFWFFYITIHINNIESVYFDSTEELQQGQR